MAKGHVFKDEQMTAALVDRLTNPSDGIIFAIIHQCVKTVDALTTGHDCR